MCNSMNQPENKEFFLIPKSFPQSFPQVPWTAFLLRPAL